MDGNAATARKVRLIGSLLFAGPEVRRALAELLPSAISADSSKRRSAAAPLARCSSVPACFSASMLAKKQARRLNRIHRGRKLAADSRSRVRFGMRYGLIERFEHQRPTMHPELHFL